MENIIVKNQPIFTRILNNINNYNKNIQAYMLVGSSKQDLIESALLLSKVLACPNKYESNCKKCNICKRIDDNLYGELKIINPVNKTIKKEEIEGLKDEFSTREIEGKRQVYIINDAEVLNVSSANSILKFLEEPDGDVVAIFTTTNLDMVIKTIVSRCQVIKLNNSSNLGIDIVKMYSSLDEDEIYNVIEFIKKIEKKYALAVQSVKNDDLMQFNNREKLTSMLNVMILYYKDCLNYKILGSTKYFDKNEVKLVADLYDSSIINKKITFILENLSKLEYNVNCTIFLMNLVIGIGEIRYDKSNRN